MVYIDKTFRERDKDIGNRVLPDISPAANTIRSCNMDRLLETLSRQTGSPDPASHAANAYDTPARESEIDELDDDDMDFEPASDDSEDAEYFDADENDQDYRGMATLNLYRSLEKGRGDEYG